MADERARQLSAQLLGGSMDAYRPPDAALTEPEPFGPEKRFRLLPVVVGGLVIDFLGTNVISAIAMIPFIIVAARSGIPMEQHTQQVVASPLFLWPVTAVGLGLTVLGGYVAARWAANQYRLHGAAAGSIAFFLSLPLLLLDAPVESFPLWLTYGGLALQIPLALFGGWMAERRAA